MSIRNLGEAGVPKTVVSAPFCVVGAGMAGLLLARRLAQAGRRVVLIESGRDGFDPESQRLNEIDDVHGNYRWPVVGRIRALGGTSLGWGGRIISLTQQEADPRPYYALPGWPFPVRELEAYRYEIEGLFKVDDSPFEEDMLKYLDRERLFPHGDPDVTCRWVKWTTIKRGNLAALLRKEIKSIKPLEVWLDATVCGFGCDPESGRLLSIRARSLKGQELVVQADDFVFAAGTIETTRLLLLLDRACDKRPFERCRALGRYFQDHLDAQIGRLDPKDPAATNLLFGPRLMGSARRTPHLELSRAATEADVVAGAFAHVAVDVAEHPAFSAAKTIYDRLRGKKFGKAASFRTIARNYRPLSKFVIWRVAKRRIFVPEGVEYKLRVCIEQAPQWQNRIHLSEKRDRFGIPMAQVDWKPTEQDERTFRAAIARIGSYWSRSGFDRICPIEWSQAAKDPSRTILDEAQDWCHPSGTTRMGLDPAESVVGPDLRCHHVANVSVVSASTFPSAGSVNPTLTIMQLALRCADSLLKRSEGARPH